MEDKLRTASVNCDIVKLKQRKYDFFIAAAVSGRTEVPVIRSIRVKIIYAVLKFEFCEISGMQQRLY
jgi:hypothetical protein